MAWPCAARRCEPREARKGAAVSSQSRAPQAHRAGVGYRRQACSPDRQRVHDRLNEKAVRSQDEVVLLRAKAEGRWVDGQRLDQVGTNIQC